MLAHCVRRLTSSGTTLLSIHRGSQRINACRHLATPSTKTAESSQVRQTTSGASVPDPWMTVYRFNYVRGAAFLNRVKVWQTAFLVGVAAPHYIWKVAQGEVTLDEAAPILTLASFATCTLIAVGELSRRLVGFLYWNKESRKIKIGHVTFFGRRKNIIVNLEDVIPINDSDQDISQLIWSMKFYEGTTDDTGVPITRDMLISTKYGEIKNPEGFKEIFGDCL